MAVTREIAELEAKLRGLELTFQHYHDGGLIPQVSGWYEDGKCKCKPGGAPFVGHRRATDPATPEGREWWCEALTIESLWTPESRQWSAEVNWRDLGICKFDRSRAQAIIAAIEAAAAEHGAATQEG